MEGEEEGEVSFVADLLCAGQLAWERIPWAREEWGMWPVASRCRAACPVFILTAYQPISVPTASSVDFQNPAKTRTQPLFPPIAAVLALTHCLSLDARDSQLSGLLPLSAPGHPLPAHTAWSPPSSHSDAQ